MVMEPLREKETPLNSQQCLLVRPGNYSSNSGRHGMQYSTAWIVTSTESSSPNSMNVFWITKGTERFYLDTKTTI
eukprot:scaffold4062_cov101-Alexandrium_tamarense.AAC.2